MKQAPVNIKNKRATFDYELIDTYTAGIVLTGTEIKSIRLGKAVPVRYTSNGAFFLQHKVKTTTPNFKGRKEALQFTNNEENSLFHKETKIRI